MHGKVLRKADSEYVGSVLGRGCGGNKFKRGMITPPPLLDN
ncbi:MAG: hypothetical protein PHR25_04855 [Clostridia bacterium]|nr:hypothetical protein [Clostridia bacterium]MDD4376094.1 hypothetical protein [Clostridia bacterium]